MSSNIFGKFVKKHRINKGFSTIVLSEMVGCHPSYIRGIERGSHNPSQEFAQRILRNLDVGFYVRDAYKLELKKQEGGFIFEFNSSKHGDNGLKTLTKKKEDRLIALETRVAALETRLNI